MHTIFTINPLKCKIIRTFLNQTMCFGGLPFVMVTKIGKFQQEIGYYSKDTSAILAPHHVFMWLDWIVQCFTSPPQCGLYGRRFLQVKRPNQQYQSTEDSHKGKSKERKQLNHTYRHTIIDTKKIYTK